MITTAVFCGPHIQQLKSLQVVQALLIFGMWHKMKTTSISKAAKSFVMILLQIQELKAESDNMI